MVVYIMPHMCELESDSDHEPSSIKKFVCKWLRKLSLIYIDHPKTYFFFKSQAAFDEEYYRHLGSNKYTLVLHPFSRFCLVWDVIMLFVEFILAFLYIFIVAFFEDNVFLYVCLDVCDLVAMLNICFTLLTGYANIENRHVNLNPDVITSHYITSFFLVHYLQALPINYLWHFEDTKKFGILIFFKLMYMRCLLKRIFNVLMLIHWDSIYDALRYILLIIFCIHSLGGIFKMVPALSKIYRGHFSANSWIMVENVRNTNYFEGYLTCMYRSSLLFFGIDNRKHRIMNPRFEEQMMFSLTTLLGDICFFFLFAQFLILLENANILEMNNLEISSNLEQFIINEKIPESLQQRLEKYYRFRFSKLSFKESKITKLLTQRLQQEVNVEYCRRFLYRVQLFRNIPEKIMSKVLSHLHKDILLPKDVLLRCGTQLEKLYILAKGTMAVYSCPEMYEVCHLMDGAVIGEMELLTYASSLTTIVALEICEVWSLSRSVFLRCFKDKLQFYEDIIGHQGKLSKPSLHALSKTLLKKELEELK